MIKYIYIKGKTVEVKHISMRKKLAKYKIILILLKITFVMAS